MGNFFSSNNLSRVKELPDEILFTEILSYLPLRDLPNLLVISKDFNRKVLSSHSLLYQFSLYTNPFISLSNKTDLKDRKMTYSEMKKEIIEYDSMIHRIKYSKTVE